MYYEEITLLRMLSLSVLPLLALIIQRVLCPLFQCWTHGRQSHSRTCAKEGAWGGCSALLCNSAFPNRSSTLLKM